MKMRDQHDGHLAVSQEYLQILKHYRTAHAEEVNALIASELSVR